MLERRASVALLLAASGCGSFELFRYDPPPEDTLAFPTPTSPPIDFGSEEESDPPPPAIAGGTLLVMRDGVTAVAADPDRDVVWVADLDAYEVRGSIALEAGDEPGRLVEDGAGRVHVLARRSGAVITLDPASASVRGRKRVCAAPRGIAHDAARDALIVACASGQLLTLAPDDLSTRETRTLPPDLRDVVVDGDRLWVSRFRSAEILELRGGDLTTHALPETGRLSFSGHAIPFLPAVAWRLVADPRGGIAVLHQRASAIPLVVTVPGGYYQGQSLSVCAASVVETAVTRLGRSSATTPPLSDVVLGVDLAVSPSGNRWAVAAPGGGTGRAHVVAFLDQELTTTFGGSCTAAPYGTASNLEAVAVAFNGERMVYQSRLPAGLVKEGWPILSFGVPERPHLGHAIFHRDAGSGTACASCHPEAGDDGRVWRFDNGVRARTQSLRGGLLATAPYHWDGSLADIHALMGEVFEKRMLGPRLERNQTGAVGRWLDRLAVQAIGDNLDPGALARGRAIFDDPTTACATCHSGPAMTNNATVDVGTGGTFQVPSLRGLAARAPFLHDGRAATIADRFQDRGGGDAHGHTSQLTAAQLADLVAYLGAL